jgi:hypothetical protein
VLGKVNREREAEGPTMLNLERFGGVSVCSQDSVRRVDTHHSAPNFGVVSLEDFILCEMPINPLWRGCPSHRWSGSDGILSTPRKSNVPGQGPFSSPNPLIIQCSD